MSTVLTKTRIAIIGGGAAGLIAARHVSSHPETYSFTVFEQTDEVGGTWVYTDETEFDKYGQNVLSSMYKNLSTNIPKEIMQIPDFPFEEKGGPSFVHHSVIRQYLLDYTNHYDLLSHLKFHTLVTNIEPETLENGRIIWLVTYQDLQTRIDMTGTYDAVIICNGCFTVSHMPNIPGIDDFPGEIVHSHQYRTPEGYTGKKVCILGASWSGSDIALEVAQYAEKIYLSHELTEPLNSKLPSNLEEKPGIQSIKGHTFTFFDGTTTQVDKFICCTGYKFTYPFMSSKVEIRTDDNHVEPIYKYLVHMDTPNLFFMGALGLWIPFPMFHMQVAYILGVIDGRIKLPSPKQMRKAFEKEKNELIDSGIPLKHINQLKDRTWAYCDEISAAAGVPSFSPVVRKIAEHSAQMRVLDLITYKNYEYRIIDDENFSVNYCEPR